MRKTRNKKTRNPDRVTAAMVASDAYLEIDAFASLDDEIENWERLNPCMPFGGEDQPIRGFQGPGGGVWYD
jgi:hypothetical protein